MSSPPILRRLGRADYELTWRAMRAFTAGRAPDTPDELWLVEHPPVFTLGQAGKREHLLADVGIPVIPVDRGGQVTYHGPGQAVIYVLVDLRRRGYGVRDLVGRLEQAVIDLLADYGVTGERLAGAPGVYVAWGAASDGGTAGVLESPPAPLFQRGGQVDGETGQRLAKVAALGLRIRGGCSYHGLALNVDMDLAPFAAINPCGYAGLPVTQLRDLGIGLDVAGAWEALAEQLQALL
jgi:lipoyl(octanoyl) transferase